MSFIQVENVTKEFKVYRRYKGFFNTIKSLFHRQYEIKKAVDNISFNLNKGDLVGYIGPNGAGKSTTIKMLTGILLPTSGKIIVNGRIPYINRKENALHIGVVFGQRSQLYWDLPVDDTFELYRKMYKIDNSQFRRNKEFYTDLLGLQEFLNKPVRQLSLGQKMRANIAIALLHDPEIVYLDEPTIGLDVVAKNRIRRFIQEVNRERKTTVILTTHDMDDIEQICNRLIMIDKGLKIYDGTVQDFKSLHNSGFMILVDFADDDVCIVDERFNVVSKEGPGRKIVCNKEIITIGEAVSFLTRNYTVSNILIKETEIEEIVRNVYETGGMT